MSQLIVLGAVARQLRQRGATSHHRNVTQEEVGDTCLFLAGPHSRGITGTTIFVDAGFHIMGA